MIAAAPVIDVLQRTRARAWTQTLAQQVASARPHAHGDLPRWQSAVDKLPSPPPDAEIRLDAEAVGACFQPSPTEHRQIHDALMQLHPWRKGPFEVGDVHVDAEWRSDLKWERLRPHVSWEDALVLDVGCGNGYFGFRILGAGARLVIGVDPMTLFGVQHAAIRKITGPFPNFVLPLRDSDVPALEAFDVTLSMGVIYHRKSPFGHLQTLYNATRPGGTVVVESLVVRGDVDTCLTPKERYAKMRNVWLIPSPDLLCRWMTRMGLVDVHCVDVTVTSSKEQRATPWMGWESLAHFLDPKDPVKTLEGYPAPTRGIIVGRKPPA